MKRFPVIILTFGILSGFAALGRNTIPAGASGSVTLSKIRFYSGKHFAFGSCRPRGSASRSFPNTVKHIYNYVVYGKWNGKHRDRDEWFSPHGSLYFQSRAFSYRGKGGASDCGSLRIAGTKAAAMLGSWTYKLYVDGHLMGSRSFTLHRSHARPGRIVPSSVKFYRGNRFDYSSCTPHGSPSRSFSSKTKHINVLDTFSDWQGLHADQDRWYSPHGKLYFQSAANNFVGSGPTKDCGQLNVAGTDAAHMRGKWTYRLVVDGHIRKTARFRLR